MIHTERYIRRCARLLRAQQLALLVILVGLGFTAPAARGGGGPGGLVLGGTYTFATLLDRNNCLTANNNGSFIQLDEYACTQADSQLYSVQDAGNALVSLVQPANGLCVDIRGAATNNGTPLELWSCNGAPWQQFSPQPDASGNVTFLNPYSGRCLDLTGASTVAFTPVQLWDCSGAYNQTWAPTLVSAPGGGTIGGLTIGTTYAFATLLNRSACLTANDNGSFIQLDEYSCIRAGSQMYTVQDAGNGLVTLHQPQNGLCVDIRGGTPDNGTPVELWNCNGAPWQQFSPQPDASGNVTFLNPYSGRCLDPTGASTALFTPVQLWDCSGAYNQTWVPLPQ